MGKRGKPGTAGNSGFPGASGADGAPGPQGPHGPSGIEGTTWVRQKLMIIDLLSSKHIYDRATREGRSHWAEGTTRSISKIITKRVVRETLNICSTQRETPVSQAQQALAGLPGSQVSRGRGAGGASLGAGGRGDSVGASDWRGCPGRWARRDLRVPGDQEAKLVGQDRW